MARQMPAASVSRSHQVVTMAISFCCGSSWIRLLSGEPAQSICLTKSREVGGRITPSSGNLSLRTLTSRGEWYPHVHRCETSVQCALLA